jgi:hypothetical protein
MTPRRFHERDEQDARSYRGWWMCAAAGACFLIAGTWPTIIPDLLDWVAGR